MAHSYPITLAEAKAQLSAWQDASLALATGQSYSLGGRSLTRSNAMEVQQMITYWTRQVRELTALDNGATHGAHAVAVVA